jgi:hypothetical protein
MEERTGGVMTALTLGLVVWATFMTWMWWKAHLSLMAVLEIETAQEFFEFHQYMKGERE